MSRINQTRNRSAAAAMTVMIPVLSGTLGYLLDGPAGLAWGLSASFLLLMIGARADARTRRAYDGSRQDGRSSMSEDIYGVFRDAAVLLVDAVVVLGRQAGWIMFGINERTDNDAHDLSALALRNRRLFRACAFASLGMLGLAFAAVPLYAMFCSVTGYGGTPAKSEGNFKGIVNRPMTVRFDANIDRNLPWGITPAASVTRDIGTVELVNYVATNTSDEPITGMAVFNVAPEKAAVYFNKVECFCFTEQTLQPGETLDMPIVFFVDPDLDANRELDTIKEITLSYTFYRK